MSATVEQEIKNLKEEVQKKRTAYAVKLAKRDELLAVMNGYGIKGDKQAEKREGQLEKEISDLKDRLDALIQKASARLDKYEGTE